VPSDLKATWAWDALFLEYHPYSATFQPPPVMAPVGVVVGIGLMAVSIVKFGSLLLTLSSLLVVLLGLAASLFHQHTMRRRSELRILLRLGRDSLVVRRKLHGLIEAEESYRLAKITEVSAGVSDDEQPELRLRSSSGVTILPMGRTETVSVEWLRSVIQERCAGARARRTDGAAEIPGELRRLVAQGGSQVE